MRMKTDLYFAFCSLLLFVSPNVSNQWQQGRPCSYNFQVWYPERSMLERIRDIEYKMANVSNYIEKEFLVLKHSALSELHVCQNWTARLERDVMNLRMSELHGKIKYNDLDTGLSEISRKSDQVTKKLEAMENELQNIRLRDHKKRMIGAEVADGTVVQEGGVSFNDLRDTVIDLKAEWILMKRDIFKLQNDLLKSTEDHVAEENKTHVIQERVRQLSQATNAVQKKLEHGEAKIRILNSNFDRLKQIVASKLENLQIIKQELEEMRVEMMKSDKKQDVMPNGQKQNDFHPPQQVLQSRITYGVNERRDTDPPGFSPVPTDCEDVRKQGPLSSGVYQIRPNGSVYAEDVYCEFVNSTAYNVIQRRVDGLLDFDRKWVEYKYGFGSLYGDHWLGNEIVHLLSIQRNYILRIDIWDWEGGKAYAEYSVFSVDNEVNKYSLTVSGYSGNAGDSLSYHNGMKFSTEDNDNDVNIRSCATDNKSGWWFESCFLANLNGVYRKGWYAHAQSTSSDGIVWYTWKNSESYSLKKVEMKMRRAI